MESGGRPMGQLNMSMSSKLSVRRCRNDSGFTLLESVIALGILAFGILSVAGALITSIKFSRQSRSLTQAMNLAEQQIELFQSMPAADVLIAASVTSDPLNPIDPSPGDADTRTFTRSWTIQDAAVEAGVISMTVLVNWVDETGASRVVQLESLKANR